MKTQIQDFIRAKIADVEKSIKGREDMERIWRGGTDEQWKKVAKMNGAKPTTKAERILLAERHARILVKLRHELEMFNGVLSELITSK